MTDANHAFADLLTAFVVGGGNAARNRNSSTLLLHRTDLHQSTRFGRVLFCFWWLGTEGASVMLSKYGTFDVPYFES